MQRIHCPILTGQTPGEACLRGYGYGLVVEEHPRHGRIVQHSGGYPGFSSHMRWSTRTGIGIVTFENATYSGARDPATAALERVLDAVPRHSEPPAVPAGIRRLVPADPALLEGAGARFDPDALLENVVQDRSEAERLAEIAALLTAAGRPDPAGARVASSDGVTFSRFEVTVPCAQGDLAFSVQVGPILPPRIQALSVGFVARA